MVCHHRGARRKTNLDLIELLLSLSFLMQLPRAASGFQRQGTLSSNIICAFSSGTFAKLVCEITLSSVSSLYVIMSKGFYEAYA